MNLITLIIGVTFTICVIFFNQCNQIVTYQPEVINSSYQGLT
jgi:hypothetical protein